MKKVNGRLLRTDGITTTGSSPSQKILIESLRFRLKILVIDSLINDSSFSDIFYGC